MIKHLILAMVTIMSITFSSNAANQDKILHLNIGGEPDSLDPRTSNNINAALVIAMLYQGMTAIEQDGTVSLALADKVEVSDDRKTYTFQIKKTCWSDGTELTAKDFEYGWKSCLDPKLPVPCANLLYPIKNAEAAKKGEVPLDAVGVRAKDKYTLVVELHQPVSYFLDLIASNVFYPIPQHQVENNPKWGSGSQANQVGNGSFKLTSWSHNDEIIVEKNPSYWDASSVNFERIEIFMIENESTALNLFETGKIDWIGGDYSPIPLDALPELKQKGLLEKTLYGGTRYCAYNLNAFPFNNLNMRKAFSLALNRKALIEHITLCDDEVATNMISSIFKNNQQTSLFPDGNVEMARACLQQGLQELNKRPEEIEITLEYENSEIAHRLAQAMQEQWHAALGITVKLDRKELKTFVDNLKKRNFQMGLIYWMLHYNSPMDVLDRYRSKNLLKNYPGWENKEYTELLDSYMGESTESKRQETLARMEQIFISDMAVIPLFHFSRPYLSSPKLKGLQTTPIGDIEFHKAYFEEMANRA